MGRIFTSRINIMQFDGYYMMLPGLNLQRIELPLIVSDHHLYLPMKFFTTRESSSYSQSVITTATAMPWSESRPIIEKVHK